MSYFKALLAPRYAAVVAVLFAVVSAGAHETVIEMDDPLVMPAVGAADLKILAPDLLELTLITTKGSPPARPTIWNFVAANGQYVLPAPTKFLVTANGQPALVQSVGFRRRAIYAPVRKRDLRIGNYIYLKLAAPIAEGQTVEVKNPDGTLWAAATTTYLQKAEPLRFSPAIHVNQQGYVPSFPKKAIIGYYLGSMGEMPVPADAGFKLVRASSGEVVHAGSLTARADTGYKFTPAPYQKVLEADFTAFTTAGEYKLVIPGLGASAAFRIDEGAAAAFARTYALGLYHQRCGGANELPFTRHVHGDCHILQADVPTMAITAVTKALTEFSANYTNNARHTAPQLKDVSSSLYPFVNTGKIDVSGGHHDAGDYSKYTINSAQLVHHLVFAVDNFTGVATLDNLGLPESGDGISDLLQEAKWEADFLAKMQDADGGFYFLVYPRNRAYEDNVLPDRGDPQVVFPKNTAATAAAVAALAQTASSPAFKAAYPAASAAYLGKARKGWEFLQAAFTKFGRDGAYQKISHYGNEFMHDDEVAWAAAELYLATGDRAFETELMSRFDPSSHATLRDGWTRMWEGYGAATRSYAFGVKSGRVTAGQLTSAYLTKCEGQIKASASDQVRFSRTHAYGSSFPDPFKSSRTAGWYFSVDQTFDIVTAAHLEAKPEHLDTILRNMNYEGGCNPLNISFLTGVGLKRQREMVHQYAANDRRILPPSGIPLGNIQSGFPNLTLYPAELAGLSFPSDTTANAPYAPYDMWGDTYNLTTEFVHPQQARSLGSMAYLMAMTSLKSQPWRAAAAEIHFNSVNVSVGSHVEASVAAEGLDLRAAQIVWEGRSQEPWMGEAFMATPAALGPHWVEAEAMLPDGRRVFAASQFTAVSSHRVSITEEGAIAVGGVQGQTFTLQRSFDLLEWEDLFTETFTSNSFEFSDETAAGERARFYRAIPAF